MSDYQSRNGRKNDTVYWVIAIALLVTGVAAPVGFLMIVLKLLGGRKRGRHPYYAQQEGQGPVGARTTGAEPQGTAKKKRSGRKKSSGLSPVRRFRSRVTRTLPGAYRKASRS